jgi:hypothetical protein
MKKIIDINRDKNINLHRLYLYFSINEGPIWEKNIFKSFHNYFLMKKDDVTCLHIEIIHH